MKRSIFLHFVTPQSIGVRALQPNSIVAGGCIAGGCVAVVISRDLCMFT
jgi:hypothetical protein